jgi:hypothetical protein
MRAHRCIGFVAAVISLFGAAAIEIATGEMPDEQKDFQLTLGD